MDERDLSSVAALLSDFGTRINDVEEHLRMLQERVLVVSQTALKQNERVNKDIMIMKEDIRDIREDIDRMKEMTENIIGKTAEFARRDELRLLEKYIKMFEPLKFTTVQDVKKIVSNALKRRKKK